MRRACWRLPMRTVRILFLGAAALAGVLVAGQGTSRAEDPAPVKPAAPVRNFAQALVDQIKVGSPIEADPLVLFPLVVDGPVAELGVVVHTEAGGARIAEPIFPARQFDVEAANSGSLERYLETFAHTVGVMQTPDALRRIAAVSSISTMNVDSPRAS